MVCTCALHFVSPDSGCLRYRHRPALLIFDPKTHVVDFLHQFKKILNIVEISKHSKACVMLLSDELLAVISHEDASDIDTLDPSDTHATENDSRMISKSRKVRVVHKTPTRNKKRGVRSYVDSNQSIDHKKRGGSSYVDSNQHTDNKIRPYKRLSVLKLDTAITSLKQRIVNTKAKYDSYTLRLEKYMNEQEMRSNSSACDRN